MIIIFACEYTKFLFIFDMLAIECNIVWNMFCKKAYMFKVEFFFSPFICQFGFVHTTKCNC
jgi:hypothetical protein